MRAIRRCSHDLITRLVFLTLLTLLFIQPSVTNAQGTIMGYWASNVGQPVVYFSAIFDTKNPSQLGRLNTNPWASEFNAYSCQCTRIS